MGIQPFHVDNDDQTIEQTAPDITNPLRVCRVAIGLNGRFP